MDDFKVNDLVYVSIGNEKKVPGRIRNILKAKKINLANDIYEVSVPDDTFKTRRASNSMFLYVDSTELEVMNLDLNLVPKRLEQALFLSRGLA